MRKFLIVMLILSVTGGAFAHDLGGQWGNLEAEAALSTTIDFAAPRGYTFEDTEMYGEGIGPSFSILYTNEIGPWALSLPMIVKPNYFGTNGTAALEYTVGKNFTAGIGFQGGFGKDAAREYTGDDFDYVHPWKAYGGVMAAAEYDDGNFGFRIGLKVYESPGEGDYADANAHGERAFTGSYLEMDHIGGRYGFMGGNSELVVSLGGAYSTKWWRASTIVLNPSVDFLKLFPKSSKNDTGFGTDDWGDDGHHTAWSYALSNAIVGTDTKVRNLDWVDFHWENIEANGIAYRFFVIPQRLNIGLAFVSDTPPDNRDDLGNDFDTWIGTSNNSGPFKGKTDENETAFGVSGSGGDYYGLATGVNGLQYTSGANDFPDVFGSPGDLLIQNFLKHPVLGVGYDDDKLAVSAMVGLEPAVRHHNQLTGIDKDGNDGTAGGLNYNGIGVPIGLYGNDQVDEDDFEFTRNKYSGEMNFYMAAGANFKITDSIAVFGDMSALFWAQNFYKDLNNGNAISPHFNFGIGGSYTAEKMEAGLTFKGIDILNDNFLFGSDFYTRYKNKIGTGTAAIGFSGHLNGFIWKKNNNIFDIGLFLDLGYVGLELTKQMLFSITGKLGLEIGMWGRVKDMATSFTISPVFDWNVFDNGSIQFKYELGSSDLNLKKTGDGLVRGDDFNTPKDSGGPTNPLFNTNQFTTTFKWWLK